MTIFDDDEQLPIETVLLLSSVEGRGPELLKNIEWEKMKQDVHYRFVNHVKKMIVLILLFVFSTAVIITVLNDHAVNFTRHWGLYLTYLVVCKSSYDIFTGAT